MKKILAAALAVLMLFSMAASGAAAAPGAAVQAETYTITYDPNGGVGRPDAQIKTAGTALTLSAQMPFKNASNYNDNYYIFKGWATSADAKTEEYLPGGSFAIDEDTTLYAVWGSFLSSASFIYYDPMGGSFDGVSGTVSDRALHTFNPGNSYVCWIDIDLVTVTPKRAGYTFMGWATSSTATTAEYQPGQKYGRIYGYFSGYSPNFTESPPRFHAVWQIDPNATLTLTYNANGGAGAPAQQKTKPETAFNLSDVIPTRAGHAFVGWALNADATEEDKLFSPGGEVTMNNDATLYAVWTPWPPEDAQPLTLNTDATVSIEYVEEKWFSYTPSSTGLYKFAVANGMALIKLFASNGALLSEWFFIGGLGYGPDDEIGDFTFTLTAGQAYYFKAELVDLTGETPFVMKLSNSEAPPITVTYDANGGAGAPGPQTKTPGQPLTLSETTPTRAGYAFRGWGASADASLAIYQPGWQYLTDFDTTLYAIWQAWPPAGTVPIVLDADTTVDAQTEAIEQRYYSYTPTSSGAFNFGVTDGSTAIGAVYGSDGTILAGDMGEGFSLSCDLEAGKTYYFTIMFWEAGTYTIKLAEGAAATTYTITYNANGGSGAPANQTKTQGQALTLSSTVPNRGIGDTFLGWATTNNATAAQYQPGGQFTTDANTTLYAVWADAATTSTVTYRANGGSGAPGDQLKVQDIPLTLSSTVPTRMDKGVTKDYAFKGWATSADATTAQYQPGDQFTIDADTTLYAVWEEDPPPIAIVLNGDSVTMDCTQFQYTFTPTRSGTYEIQFACNPGHCFPEFDLDGVNYKSYTGEYVNLIQGRSVSVDLNAGQTYSIVNKSYAGIRQDYAYGQPFGAPYKDYHFKGVYFTITYKGGGDTTTYTIAYDANGGTGAPANQTKTQGEALTLSSTKPTREGYTFLGWATTNNATAAQYQPGGSFTTDANTTLYAVWEQNAATTYTITYNANGGTGAPANQTKTQGEALTLSSTKPTRAGYSFLGWAATNNATVAEYQAGGQFTADANITLYAVWEADAPTIWTITFDANGGEGAPDPQSKAQGEYLTLSETAPTRTDYTFKGWATSSSAIVAQTEYSPGRVLYPKSDITLYAVWEQGASVPLYYVHVYYDLQDGVIEGHEGESILEDTISFTNANYLDVAHTLTAAVPTRAGYTFNGWTNTEKTESFAPGQNVTLKRSAADVVHAGFNFYAVWEQGTAPATYTITYDANGGEGAPANQTKTQGQALTLSSTKATRKGYSFLGWAATNNATVAEYQAGGQFTADADTTLYAVWEADAPTIWTIAFDANGGEGAPGSQTKTPGQALTLSSTQPTRAGYTFLGWAITDNATVAQYQAGGQFTTDADTTLYAVWQQNAPATYSLTVVNGAGSGSYAAEAQVTITANAAPSGKVFDKWTASAGALASATSATTTFTMPAGAATVTASYKDAPAPPPPPNTIFSTGYEATFLNWILFIVCFGWIWMWFI